MKNKLDDLNNHLFAQIERLSDEQLTEEQIETEVKRAGAIVSVADQIVGIADKKIRAAKMIVDHGNWIERHLPEGIFKSAPAQIKDKTE